MGLSTTLSPDAYDGPEGSSRRDQSARRRGRAGGTIAPPVNAVALVPGLVGGVGTRGSARVDWRSGGWDRVARVARHTATRGERKAGRAGWGDHDGIVAESARGRAWVRAGSRRSTTRRDRVRVGSSAPLVPWGGWRASSTVSIRVAVVMGSRLNALRTGGLRHLDADIAVTAFNTTSPRYATANLASRSSPWYGRTRSAGGLSANSSICATACATRDQDSKFDLAPADRLGGFDLIHTWELCTPWTFQALEARRLHRKPVLVGVGQPALQPHRRPTTIPAPGARPGRADRSWW